VIGYPIESWLKGDGRQRQRTFYCCRFVAPLMWKRAMAGSSNISSVAGKEGNPNASSYSAPRRRCGASPNLWAKSLRQGRDRQCGDTGDL